MRYPRNPYVQNVTLKNLRESGQATDVSLELQNLADMLENESNVFEIGFNMGERLNYLKNLGISVLGGVEFDPIFGTYANKHYGVYDSFKIVLTSLDDWFQGEDVMFTYHFLDQFTFEERQVLITKIKESAKKVYFVESVIIEGAENVLGVQVYDSSDRGEVDDRDEDSSFEQESDDSDKS